MDIIRYKIENSGKHKSVWPTDNVKTEIKNTRSKYEIKNTRSKTEIKIRDQKPRSKSEIKIWLPTDGK